MKAWLLIIPLFFVNPTIRAALKWDRLQAELAPGPSDKSVEAKFGFVNEGKTAVTIESLKPSCGCTTTTLDKKTYAPGEKGEVGARFDIGQRVGVQSKTVAVKIEGEPNPTVLTLVVTIPDLVKIEPSLVIWEMGEANKPKEIALRALPGQPIRILKVTSSDPGIRTKVDTGRDGKDYVISVTPDSTETASFAILNIESSVGSEVKTFPAYAQVKPAALGKKADAPGGKEEVRARLDIGQQAGVQSKPVAVKVGGEHAPAVLTPVLPISALVKIEPSLVVWEKGEASKPKEIALRVPPGQPIRALKVTSTDPSIRIKVHMGKDGTDCLISVTPESTEAPSFATLNIESNVGNEIKTFQAHAQVKAAAP